MAFKRMAETANGNAITKTLGLSFERIYKINKNVLTAKVPIVKSIDCVSSNGFLVIVFISLNIKSFLNRLNWELIEFSESLNNETERLFFLVYIVE
jgi:hypothetical protein